MSINYRAVHVGTPWRKVGIHQTLASAIDGKDGARNLLLRIGRVADKWNKYRDVSCVFVWEEGADTGYALRLRSGQQHIVQQAEVPASQLQAFDRQKGCSAAEIDLCFGSTSASTWTENTLPESSNAQIEQQPPIQDEYAALNIGQPYPDELPGDGEYVEGLAREVLVNAFERSQQARNACISHYGCACQVCKLDFGSKYGPIGRGFIHVHHRVPISSVGAEYRVNAIADLVPVCPNCHAMLHRYEPPLSVEELSALLNDG